MNGPIAKSICERYLDSGLPKDPEAGVTDVVEECDCASIDRVDHEGPGARAIEYIMQDNSVVTVVLDEKEVDVLVYWWGVL